MLSSLPRIAALLACAVFRSDAVPETPDASSLVGLKLQRGDHLCYLGNGLAERMQHHGWLETLLQARFPDHELSFRNLGFSADELSVQQRTAGFGSWDDYLTRCAADVIFAFFGYNESFAGAAGLTRYQEDLEEFIDHSLAQKYNGHSAPRLVLFSSIPCEDLADPNLPDPRVQNSRIALYARATAEVARARGVPFVDLLAPLHESYASARTPLTLNGIHLREHGNELLARAIVAALFSDRPGDPPEEGRLASIRTSVGEKNLLWFNRYRATDGYNVYGGRSALKYTEDLSNFEVLQREMEVLDARAAQHDRLIWARARGAAVAARAAEIPALIEVKTNKPGEGAEGAHTFLDGRDALAKMTPAAGLVVNLFASEAQFPELVNPVQMAWDTRDRLWVAVWPTYPHWKPDQPRNDKLLILEDTDADGQADVCKTFVADLHNPTGFEFWNGGVLVGCAPDLLFLTDTNGDDRVDHQERILHGLSSADTHHSANSFVIGPGGALYFQEGTFHRSQIETIYGPVRNRDGCVWRFEPRTWRVERHVPYNFANPHGHVFDRWGQEFVTDGTGNVNYYALPFSGFLAHPDKHRAYFPFFPQRSRPCAGTEILSSTHFPEENEGNYLIANVIGFQGIFQYHIEDDDSGFSATEVTPIVHSSDPSFRPSDLEVGPDGALYFLDWHNPLIGHMQHHLRDPSRDNSHGRVYRVTHAERPLQRSPRIAGRPLVELLDLLKHPADRVRYRCRIELSARGTEDVVRAVRTWVAGLDQSAKGHEHHLLEALWLQQQHHVLDQELLQRLLRSPDHRARAAATRVLRYLHRQVQDPLALLEVQVEDSHPRVRLEAVVALSSLSGGRAGELALRAFRHPMDRFLRYACGETLRALEPDWRQALASGQPFASDNEPGLAHALGLLGDQELLGVRSSGLLFEELLSRHGLDGSDYARALAGLSELRGSDPGEELLAAIQRADQRGNGHVDHLLHNLFHAVGELSSRSQASLSGPLRSLATQGQRASTRRLATAARILAEGSIEPAWEEAVQSPGSLVDLLEAAPLVHDRALADSLFPRILGLLDQLPFELPRGGTRGRYVRVELPGEERTLTLAEVEVQVNGKNLAPTGTSSQSTVAWSGEAARATDGNRSGVYGDGGQTHTIENRPNPWWELDLGAEHGIDAVTIWNRSEGDGRLGARLDGFVLRVLDRERRTVYRFRAGKAFRESMTLDLSDPSLQVQGAAVRALPDLGVHEGQAVAALVRRFGDARLRPALVTALQGVPADRWPEESANTLGVELVTLLENGTDRHFQTEQGRALLALADTLATHVEETLAARLETASRRRGPQVVVIRPLPDTLLYDRRSFSVVAGRPVELIFDNVDIMPHNLLIAATGALARVGKAAESMAASPDAWARSFIPDLPEVLHATGLLQPGESQTLRFDAPDEIGDYPYVCTFPGHWVRMNGVMHVVEEKADVTEPVAQEAATPDSQRSFVRNWSVEDLRPFLGTVASRPVERGRAVLEAASCLRCHSVDETGETVGPMLAEVTSRYDQREELLAQVLEPSRVIAEEYVTEILFLKNGRIIAGRIVAEDEQNVHVQEDPYQVLVPVSVPVEDIDERRLSKVSAMPSGLLSTFQRDEILDLLAFLESLRVPAGDGG